MMTTGQFPNLLQKGVRVMMGAKGKGGFDGGSSKGGGKKASDVNKGGLKPAAKKSDGGYPKRDMF